MPRCQGFSGRHDRTCPDDHLGLHNGAIHDHRLHPDQHPVVHGAAVQGRLMADGHIVADGQRETLRMKPARMGDVQHTAVLHGHTLADADAVHVAADHRVRPDRTVLPDDDVADDDGAGVDPYTLVNLRSDALVGANGCHYRDSSFTPRPGQRSRDPGGI